MNYLDKPYRIPPPPPLPRGNIDEDNQTFLCRFLKEYTPFLNKHAARLAQGTAGRVGFEDAKQEFALHLWRKLVDAKNKNIEYPTEGSKIRYCLKAVLHRARDLYDADRIKGNASAHTISMSMVQNDQNSQPMEWTSDCDSNRWNHRSACQYRQDGPMERRYEARELLDKAVEIVKDLYPEMEDKAERWKNQRKRWVVEFLVNPPESLIEYAKHNNQTSGASKRAAQTVEDREEEESTFWEESGGSGIRATAAFEVCQVSDLVGYIGLQRQAVLEVLREVGSLLQAEDEK